MRKLSTNAYLLCKYAHMDWSHLEYFLAVARTGSLSGAAKQLHVNHSTVARRLDKLEQQLQVRLFDRLNNGYRLTENGLALKQQAGQVEEQVNKIHRVFRGSDTELSGSLKISKPSSGIINLAPLLTDFHRQYPNIDLQLTSASAFSDLNRMEADVAIRITDNPPEDLIGRKLGNLPIYVYGSRDYLQQANTQDVAQCQWVVWQEDESPLQLENLLESFMSDPKIVLRTNSYTEVYEAVCAGMGVSLLSPQRLPKNHQLQALAPESYQFRIGLWLLSHPDLRRSARVKVFKEFAADQLEGVLEH